MCFNGSNSIFSLYFWTRNCCFFFSRMLFAFYSFMVALAYILFKVKNIYIYNLELTNSSVVCQFVVCRAWRDLELWGFERRVLNLVPSVSLLIVQETLVWPCHVCPKIRDVERGKKSRPLISKKDWIELPVVLERLLLEWILHNMVRHFVTHKQVQAGKRHPI
mgnify:CR=1 FL=1